MCLRRLYFISKELIQLCIYLQDGRADVVANDAGDRVTPAIVAYSKNEDVVGLAGKQSRIRNISNSVMKIKQILGRRYGVK